jgi:hypothetical protein
MDVIILPVVGLPWGCPFLSLTEMDDIILPVVVIV